MKKLITLLAVALTVTAVFAQTQMVRTADTVAELKTLPPADIHRVVQVLGRTAKGDGNGGMFYWDASSTATADDAYVVQSSRANVTTGRWLRVTELFEWGTGSPEGVVNAAKGTIYIRTDGSSGEIMYIKESAYGVSTGWALAGPAVTVANIGNGVGTYAQKVGNEFQFKSMTNSDGTVTISATSSNISIAASVQSLLDQITTNHGAVLFRGSSDWEKLDPGTSGQFLMTQGPGSPPVFASAPGAGGGEANAGINLGTGYKLYLDKAGTDLRFLSVTNGSGMLISSNSYTYTFGLDTPDNVRSYLSTRKWSTLDPGATEIFDYWDDAAGHMVPASPADFRQRLQVSSYVDSIEDLISLEVPTSDEHRAVIVGGYYEANDGGGDPFFYDPDSTAATNYGSVFKPSLGNGRWERIATEVNLKAWGAKGDTNTDNTTRIQAAFDYATENGRRVFVPDGDFVTGALTAGENLQIYGNGGLVSKIRKKAGTVRLISVNPDTGGTSDPEDNTREFVMRGVGLYGRVVEAGGPITDASYEHNHLLSLSAVTGATIEDCFFVGPQGDGIYLGSGNTTNTERHNIWIRIRGNYFDGLVKSNRNAISIIDGAQVYIENNLFTRFSQPFATRGDLTTYTAPGPIDMEPDSYTFHVLRDIYIRNNFFTNNAGAANVTLYVPVEMTDPVRNIVISGNVMDGSPIGISANIQGTELTNTSPYHNLVIEDNLTTNNSTRPMILLGINGARVRNNTFKSSPGPIILGYEDSLQRKMQNVIFSENTLYKVGTTEGLAPFTVSGLDLTRNWFIDIPGNAIQFSGGTTVTNWTDNVVMGENRFIDTLGVTDNAVVAVANHGQRSSNNKQLGNNLYVGVPEETAFVGTIDHTIGGEGMRVSSGAVTIDGDITTLAPDTHLILDGTAAGGVFIKGGSVFLPNAQGIYITNNSGTRELLLTMSGASDTVTLLSGSNSDYINFVAKKATGQLRFFTDNGNAWRFFVSTGGAGLPYASGGRATYVRASDLTLQEATGTANSTTVLGGDNAYRQISDSQVASGANIDAAKIGTGAISTTEFNYLDGLSASITSLLAGKQPLNGNLNALSIVNTAGIVVITEPSTMTTRTLVEGTGIDITNPNGTNGNITIAVESSVTMDTEWDTIAEIEAITAVNILVSTEADTSAELRTLLTDETGTGSAVFGTAPTIVTPLVDDYIEVNEEAAPSTPAAGKVRIYAKSDGKVYRKDDAGTEAELGGGSTPTGTPDTAAYFDGSGNLASSGSVSATELGYLDGVTGAIQTGIDSKLNKAGIVCMAFAASDETTALTTGNGKITLRAPFAFTVTGVRASVNTASSSGLVTVDINEAGGSIFSTTLTIDQSEKTSTTAATAAVISDTSIADDAEITLDIDGAGTGSKGLKIIIYGTP